MTTPAFIAGLRKRCQDDPGRISFPDSEDPRVLEVADRLLTEGSFKEVVLHTRRRETLGLGHQYGMDLERHGDKVRFEERPDLTGRLALAAELLTKGRVDCVLAGNVATTADVIRAGIAGVGLAPGVRTVSGAFIMNKPGGAIYLYADCGVCIAPTVKQLADIGTESVKTWRMLFPEVEPVVAYLSFSTKGSANHELQAKQAEGAALFKAQRPDVICDGELQFDAAFDAAIGKRKAPDSAVPGRANIFVFPDLNAGNIAYKITQRLGGFEAYGPILQGLAKPFSDLSRGATVNDLMASAYINRLKATR